MIGFGALRKKAIAWQMELGAVEQIYALDWLLQAVVTRAALRATLTLRGASALAHAYFENYPRVSDAEFARAPDLDDAALERELAAAAADAARVSGLQFKLHSFQPAQARVAFTGPLGRRSAAQPFLVARFLATPPRVEPVTRALLHPFAETYTAPARVVALAELAAERIVLYAQTPRARDVFDLWFILAHGADALDAAQTRALAQRIAQAKRVVLRPTLDAAHAPRLERAWDKALSKLQPRPSAAQARGLIEKWLAAML